MVGHKTHDGHFEYLELLHYKLASMVGGIVNHDYAGLPPVWGRTIEVVT
jgi:hypothetical protein